MFCSTMQRQIDTYCTKTRCSVGVVLQGVMPVGLVLLFAVVVTLVKCI
jgi:hypothetical protein